jgi:hypothetical protein
MGRPPVEVGRTEVVRDNLNPEFSAQIIVQYFFEEMQVLTVKVRGRGPRGIGTLSL